MEWIETTESSDGARGSGEMNRHFLSAEFPLIKGPPGVNGSELLVSGGCDALITAITPKTLLEGDPRVRQLFPDAKAAEQSYYRTSGVLPIMHAVAVRTELAEADPKLVTDLFRMYSVAKQRTYASLADTTALRVTLPWVVEEVDATRALMGSNCWSYGIPTNHKTLQTALRYADEQRFTTHRIDRLDLFHSLTHTLTE